MHGSQRSRRLSMAALRRTCLLDELGAERVMAAGALPGSQERPLRAALDRRVCMRARATRVAVCMRASWPGRIASRGGAEPDRLCAHTRTLMISGPFRSLLSLSVRDPACATQAMREVRYPDLAAQQRCCGAPRCLIVSVTIFLTGSVAASRQWAVLGRLRRRCCL